jgi:hypothetical protein
MNASMSVIAFLAFVAVAAAIKVATVDEVQWDLTDWQRTPIGLAHPSCIHRVKSGSEVQDDGDSVTVVSPNGETQEIPVCRYPFILPTKRNANKGKPGFAGGWQAWTTFQSSSSFTSFLGYFSVPNAPQNYIGQTLFMFTGLQNENWVPGPNAPPAPADFEIIQPVLQYGPSAGGGGEYWTLASWYVTVNAGYLISDMIEVNAGDTIFGNMTLLSFEKWYISGVASSSGQATTLVAQKDRLKTNPWAYCTLEVYDDSDDCTNYPSNNQVYTQLALYQNGNKVTPQWQTNQNDEPICSEHATVEAPNHVTLHFSAN